MNFPQTEISFDLFGKSRTINLDNTGKLIDVTRRLVEKTGNKHILLLQSRTRETVYVYYLLEAIMYIDTFVPELKAELGIERLEDMPLTKTKELIDCYVDKILPAKEKVFDFLNDLSDEISDESNKNKEEDKG